MSRFVILQHETPPGSDRQLHWDLMLEHGDVLRTWALANEPACGTNVLADQLPDHRQHYLEYEGPISGDRGLVSRWDAGTFSIASESEIQLKLKLEGQRICCNATLDRQDQRWVVKFSSKESDAV